MLDGAALRFQIAQVEPLAREVLDEARSTSGRRACGVPACAASPARAVSRRWRARAARRRGCCSRGRTTVATRARDRRFDRSRRARRPRPPARSGTRTRARRESGAAPSRCRPRIRLARVLRRRNPSASRAARGRRDGGTRASRGSRRSAERTARSSRSLAGRQTKIRCRVAVSPTPVAAYGPVTDMLARCGTNVQSGSPSTAGSNKLKSNGWMTSSTGA